MKILHVISGFSDRQGGPTNALIGLAIAQANLRADVSILTEQSLSGLPARATDMLAVGVRLETVGVGQKHGAGRDRHSQIRELVQSSDIIHVHGVWDSILRHACFAARKCGKPYLIRTCGMLDPWALRQKRLKKKAYMWLHLRRMLAAAVAVHCTTKMEADLTTPVLPKGAHVLVEPNGVDLTEFRDLPERGTFRDSHGIGEGPLITFLGRVHPGKGVEYLLAALPYVRTPRVTVAVVGPTGGAFSERMKSIAAGLPASHRVIFTELLSGPKRIPPLTAADLFCLPSEHENFGISVVEALAAGCPVVISPDVGLAREVVEAGVGEAVVRSPQAIAAAIDRWLSRAAAGDSPRAKCSAFALSRFDWPTIASNWLKHYAVYAPISC